MTPNVQRSWHHVGVKAKSRVDFMGIDLHLYALEDEEIDQRIGDYKYRGRPERAYVRESYGHEHYATEALVPETWEHPKFPETAYEGWQEGVYVIWGNENRFTEGHVIPARYLRSRLDEACEVTEQRYNRQDWVEQHKKSLIDFVEAAEQIEREGKTVLVVNCCARSTGKTRAKPCETTCCHGFVSY